MTYGSTFAAWRQGAGQIWPAYTEHAFVRGLGDGSLSREAFLHYLRQDYIFLIHFSRAWALAVAKADTIDEMRLAASTVDGLLNQEVALHVKACAKENISETELFTTEERHENLAYTRFVMDAGYSGSFLDLLAALAPCVMGYGEIGATLAEEKSSDVYSEWIDAYGGTEYQQVCYEVGRLIDASVARRLGNEPEKSPSWAMLCHRFNTAVRLEVGFWDMGLSP